MAEPTTIATGSVIAAVAAFVLELTGVDLPPLLWAAIGAALMQGYSMTTTTRGRVFVQVITSAFVGGLIGVALGAVAGIEQRHSVLLICAVSGFGAHPLMKAFFDKLIKRVEDAK